MRGGSRAPNRSEPLPQSQTAQILPPLKRQLAFDSNKPPFVPPGHYYHFGGGSSNALDQQPDSIIVKPLVSAAICSIAFFLLCIPACLRICLLLLNLTWISVLLQFGCFCLYVLNSPVAVRRFVELYFYDDLRCVNLGIRLGMSRL